MITNVDRETISKVLLELIERKYINEFIDEYVFDKFDDIILQYFTVNNITPLIFAVVLLDEKLVKQLIQKGADVNKADRMGYTPLQRACWNGPRNNNIISLLLKAGADPNVRNNLGLTPFMCYILFSNGLFSVEILELFLNYGTDINDMDDDGDTLLIQICCKNDSYFLNVMRELIMHGADVNLPSRNGGRTVFHYIFNKYHFDSFMQDASDLLIKCGGNINKTDNFGNAPILVALSKITNDNNHKLRALQYFIEVGAEVDVKNEDGDTLLLYLCVHGNYEIIEWFLKNSSVGIQTINTQSLNLLSPLFVFCLEEFREDNNIEKVKLLLKYGASVNIRHVANTTPLFHVAIKITNIYDTKNKRRIELFNVLLNHGANINSIDIFGDFLTTAYCFKKYADMEVLKMFIECKAKLDIPKLSSIKNENLHDFLRELYYYKPYKLHGLIDENSFEHIYFCYLKKKEISRNTIKQREKIFSKPGNIYSLYYNAKFRISRGDDLNDILKETSQGFKDHYKINVFDLKNVKDLMNFIEFYNYLKE